MPVKRRSAVLPDLTRYAPLIQKLATELTAKRDFGQPLIDEEVLPRTGLIGVNVIWDEFVTVPDEDRTAVIQQAYRHANSPDAERLAYAVGYLVPEAVEAGLLPYVVEPLDTMDGWLTLGDRYKAVRDLGGTTLPRGRRLAELWCPSIADAERCRDELSRRIPGSKDLWRIRHASDRAGRTAGSPR